MGKKHFLALLWIVCVGLWITIWAQFKSENNGCFSALTDSAQKVLLADTVLLVQNSGNDCVDINEADESELVRLPGVGPVLAKKIAEYRQENGKFKSSEDLIKIKGIGPAKLEKIQGQTCF